MVSSTLVNVAEDAEIRLVRLLAEAAPSNLISKTFVQDCESCMVQSDALGLLRTIVNDEGAIAALFVLEPLDEAVSAFSLLAALLDRVPEEQVDEAAGLAISLADAVVNSKGNEEKSEAEQAKRRVILLSALYNLRSDGREKCDLMARMVKLAGANEPEMLSSGQPLGDLLTDKEASSVPAFVTLLDSWGVPSADRRALYRAVADSIPDSVARKQRFTLLLADTYDDESQVDEDGIEAAKKAAIGAIQDPVTLFSHQRSMLTMPAIKALAKNSETQKLHGLLTVFQEQKLEDYQAFIKDNGGEDAVLDPWGLSGEECVRYMRILSLCSLASEHEEIPYSTVAQTLQLPSDGEVESWVIAAVSSGLLSAKMDQLQKSVMVERSVVRRFGMDEWKALQVQLDLWKQNVRGVLEALEKNRHGTSHQSV